MNMPIQAVAVPLFDDGQGGLRVTGTRVLLERIVHAFEDGATPEGIVQSYDTLPLADVYAVLTWYLGHRAEVEVYLRRRSEAAETIRQTRVLYTVVGGEIVYENGACTRVDEAEVMAEAQARAEDLIRRAGLEGLREPWRRTPT